jgi:hypothetical protein
MRNHRKFKGLPVSFHLERRKTNRWLLTHNFVMWCTSQHNHTVTCISSARQRLAKHVSKCYSFNKDRRPVLANGFAKHVPVRVGLVTMEIADFSVTKDKWTAVVEPLKTVFCIWFAQGYERRAVCRRIRVN